MKAKSPTSITPGKPAAGIVDRELPAEYQITFCKFFSYCVVPENFPTDWKFLEGGRGGRGEVVLKTNQFKEMYEVQGP